MWSHVVQACHYIVSIYHSRNSWGRWRNNLTTTTMYVVHCKLCSITLVATKVHVILQSFCSVNMDV